MTLSWAVLVLAALASGALLVAVLALPPRLELPAAFLSLLTFGVAVDSALTLLLDMARPDVAFYVAAFIIAGGIGGWVVGGAALESLPQRSSRQTLPVDVDELGRDALVLVACVEPARYSITETAAVLRDVASQGVFTLSLGSLPLMFFAQKARYRASGGTSPSEADLLGLVRGVDAALGHTLTVTDSRCAGPDGLPGIFAKLVRAGHKRIAVCALSVGEPLALSNALAEVDAMRPEGAGVQVVTAEPLASSEAIISACAERIMLASTGSSSPGVVLVGHGQFDEVARRNPGYDEAETRFMNRVRMRLVDSGFDENHVRVAWAQWGIPDVTTAVRHLAVLDCDRVVVSPCAFVVNSLETRLDLPIAVAQARLGSTVGVVTLPAWGDDPTIVSEIVRVARAAL